MTEQLSQADVRRIASLSRLALRDDEVPVLQRELGTILAYVERLRSAPLEGVEPLTHVGQTGNRLREDVPGPTLTPEALAKMAPERFQGFVRIPKVLGQGGGA